MPFTKWFLGYSIEKTLLPLLSITCFSFYFPCPKDPIPRRQSLSLVRKVVFYHSTDQKGHPIRQPLLRGCFGALLDVLRLLRCWISCPWISIYIHEKTLISFTEVRSDLRRFGPRHFTFSSLDFTFYFFIKLQGLKMREMEICVGGQAS